jgi:hypothetical protein
MTLPHGTQTSFICSDLTAFTPVCTSPQLNPSPDVVGIIRVSAYVFHLDSFVEDCFGAPALLSDFSETPGSKLSTDSISPDINSSIKRLMNCARPSVADF